jgi:chemosensory pili system protein ChpA (sensor histidine kinase/response regulator)
MTARAEFDVGPLSWVKGEIDLAMQRGLEALRAFAANPGDGTQLKFSQTHLHQAHGALQIVGLDGVTRVSEEVEGLLGDMEKDAALRKPEVFALAEQAFQGVLAYLDQLVAGNPNQPLRLFPLYRDLAKSRAAARDVDQTDLYFPDLSFRPPKRDGAAPAMKPGEVEQVLRDQRGRYQRGFLRWLKGDSGGAADMREAVAAIEAAQGQTSQRAFWWVALAFFDALLNKALPADLDAKRLCNRIEQQIKRMVEGSPSVAERLMREVLYYAARAQPVTEHLRAVQETYHLEQTLPSQGGVDIVLSAEHPGLKPARDLLGQAKDTWNKFASGNPPSLLAFRDAAGALKQSIAQLGNGDLAALAGETSAVASWLAQHKDKMSEAIALEVATALLLLENAVGGFSSLGAEFAQQAQLVCSRLKDCVLGKLLRTAPDIPLLDEMSRRAQERLLMNQVVTEMQANLRTIEQALDTFFRDPARRDGLQTLDTPMRQLLGALTMLGEARAQETLMSADAEIRRFADSSYTPVNADFERVAQTLSGLGFYIEALAHGKADFDAAMQPITAKRPVEALETSQPVASLEAQIAEQKREAAALYEEWKKKPQDVAVKAELQKNLEALQKDAEFVADSRTGASAEEALKALDMTRVMPLEPSLAGALGRIAPVAPAQPSPQAAKMLEASAEQIDAELLGVYLEESEEVLATIRENLGRAQSSDKEALTTIRRGFHTLKGSGRMVGLTRLGEAAWSVEQTMNVWLHEERPVTSDLLRLIETALIYFADNVVRLKAGGATSDERALAETAEKVRSGQPLPEETPAPIAAEQRALEAPLPGFELEPIVPEAPAQQPKIAPAQERDLVPASSEEEQFIELGGQRLSTTLFTIFCGEARAHLAAIREEHETLKQHGIVTDTLLRAVHTLAGIGGTVKLAALCDVGFAFEHALHKLATSELSEEEQALVGETIDTMERMAEDGIELRVPAAMPDLVARLTAVGTGAAASAEASGEKAQASASPALAAEEAALAADLDAVPEATPDLEVEEIPMERRQRRLEDDLDPQLLPVFLEEAQELVPSIGTAVRDWKTTPANTALGQALQRLLHTLKGSARMAGAMAIGELTHYMEARVEHALSTKNVSAALFEELETSYDRMGLLHERIHNPDVVVPEHTPAPAPVAAPVPAAAASAQVPAPAPAMTPVAAVAPQRAAAAEREAIAQRAILRVRAEVVDRLVNEAGEVSIARSRIEGEMRSLKGAMQELTDNVARLRAQLREIEIQAESQMQSRMEMAKESQRDFDPLEFDRFTRFQEVTRLMAESVNDVSTVHGNLINTVDETEKALLAQARLNRDLQQDLMRVRMVPFASLSDRLYRIVRQTAKETGKRANLEIGGTQVELDRSVLERITAPFEHLLRNAITHGIETPPQRVAAGKQEIGEIRLDLTQESNEVQIILADDGAGLNIPRIRQKAIELGMLGERIALSDAEIADFIFQPGFSTATEVTQLAGRGVGMDVVRNEIAALGGRIELKFEAGKGTKFTIFLPLTLAVTQAVIIRAASRIWAIPAVMVEQVLQVREEQLKKAYKSHHAEWQDRRYPFHYLPQLLGIPEVAAEQKRFSPVLFLRSGSNAISLHVDEMLGSNQEIVVKAIGPQLQRIAGITGATVLGTGEIVLILNPVQLALREVAATPVVPSLVRETPKAQPAAQPTIMVVDDSLTVRKITGRLLERQGYRVVTARDGVEAMEKLQEVVPDVMLVDVEMPRMDGFDLTRNVRADARTGRVPIIMITSRTADKHQNYAREIGVNVFLGKPYQEDRLLAEISGFLQKRKAAA